jgi:hypothetical protein
MSTSTHANSPCNCNCDFDSQAFTTLVRLYRTSTTPSDQLSLRVQYHHHHDDPPDHRHHDRNRAIASGSRLCLRSWVTFADAVPALTLALSLRYFLSHSAVASRNQSRSSFHHKRLLYLSQGHRYNDISQSCARLGRFRSESCEACYSTFVFAFALVLACFDYCE